MAIKPNKQYTTISPQGKEFILHYCTNKNRLSGSYKYDMKDGGPRAGETVTANINGVTTGEEYANALIGWYNQYGKEFNINPNVMAAQGWQESGQYTAYAYNAQDRFQTTAMGVSQFTVNTLFTIVIADFYNVFSEDEIDRILKGTTPIEGKSRIYLKNYFIVTEDMSSKTNPPSTNDQIDVVLANKPFLYQNVIDNPDIMIKAQAVYLRGISDFNANVAASALSLYYAGPLIFKGREDRIIRTEINGGEGTDNYGAVIDELNTNSDYPASRLDEAVNYSRKIFELLGNKHPHTGGRGFGFKLSFDEIKGADLKDRSKSLPLRTQKKKVVDRLG